MFWITWIPEVQRAPEVSLFDRALEALLHVAKDDNRKREVFSRGAVTNAINLHDYVVFYFA